MMVDVEQVIAFHGLKPSSLGYEKTDKEKLEHTLTKWIKQCEDMIKKHCNNDFKKEVPPAVENVCLRLVGNMITLAIQKRDSPIIKVNDWTVTPVKSDIFTDDLKNDLTPFIIEHSRVSDTVSFYAITGDD